MTAPDNFSAGPSLPQCTPTLRLAPTSQCTCTASAGLRCCSLMNQRGTCAPMAICARSKPSPFFRSLAICKAGARAGKIAAVTGIAAVMPMKVRAKHGPAAPRGFAARFPDFQACWGETPAIAGTANRNGYHRWLSANHSDPLPYQETKMTISMYQASVPRFVNILGNLSNILDKAQAHIDAKKIADASLTNYRLFPTCCP